MAVITKYLNNYNNNYTAPTNGSYLIYGLDGSDTIYGAGGDDTIYGGDGRDYLAGQNGNDVLHGGNGADILSGGSGNDFLAGGVGNDTLNGGSGMDTFKLGYVGSLGTDIDVIQSYVSTDDTIQLNNAAFTKLKLEGQQQANGKIFYFAEHFNTTGDGIPEDGNDYITYNNNTGALYYDADGSGSASPKIQIALLGINLALTADDFQIV